MEPVPRALWLVVFLAAWLLACDRNVEPFDAAERPRPPDLARLFPPGAERAAEADARGPQGRPAPGVRGGGAPVRGTVVLSEGVAERPPGTGTLFVIARAEAGGPPLAVKRIEAPRFPMDFEIGPGDRMTEATPFAGPLRLSARLDEDGNAGTRAPGDLQGAAERSVEPGARGVRIVLDQALAP